MISNKVKADGFQGQAVILAGGFGTRLQSIIGSEIPKPMAPIAGIPLLQRQLKLLKSHGFTRIILLVHHQADYIKSYFGNGDNFGVEIRYSIEDIPRGTAGAIFDCLTQLSDVFLIIYGDTYLDVDLSHFYECKKSEFSVLTFCHPNSHPFDSDLLMLDSSGRVLRVFRPSKVDQILYQNLVNAALYVVDKRVFQLYVESVGVIDISSELFPVLLENNETIQAYKSVEFIKDMGTPERYSDVEESVVSGATERLSRRNKRLCIFLDRDGVINREVGHLTKISQFELLPNVAKAIKLVNRCGVLVICVTNQPVIARGDITLDELAQIHMKMEVELGKAGAYLDDIYFCPHHPDKGFDGEVPELKIACDCRKPMPGMMLKAIDEYNIDKKKSWLIGDHDRDIIAGHSAGLKTVFMDQNLERKEGHEYIGNLVHTDLLIACQEILKEMDVLVPST